MEKKTSRYRDLDRRARLKLPFRELDYRPVSERISDFEEVVIHFDEERAMYEASRCLQCPEPSACMKACPAHQHIPLAMRLISEGKFIEAANVFRESSNFPEICGRVCPQEHLCEGSCALSRQGKPIHIGALEAFVTDYQRKHEPQNFTLPQPSGKNVAVIGGGPSGLACAEELAKKGHWVTIFESMPLSGGLLLYGIPGFKLPDEVFFAKLTDLMHYGIRFATNTEIGKERTLDDLLKEGFDAVYIAVGAGVDAKMKVAGEDLPGVYESTEFLVQANVNPHYLPLGMVSKPDIGKKVVVIGGGDTASDCLRTAIRLGAEKVTCLYRRTEDQMPGGSKDRSLAKQEGAQFQFLTQPVRFWADENGHLKAVECIRTELGEPDKDGRRRPVNIEGSNFLVDADSAVLALGYWPHPVIGETTPDLKTQKWGLVVIDAQTGMTSREGIFAGGDAVNGPDLVVKAMADGRRAAEGIHAYLNEKE